MRMSNDYSHVTADNFRNKTIQEESDLFKKVRDFILHLLNEAHGNGKKVFERRLGSIRGGLANHLQAAHNRRDVVYGQLGTLTAESFKHLVQQIIDSVLKPKPHNFKAKIEPRPAKGTYGETMFNYLVVSW